MGRVSNWINNQRNDDWATTPSAENRTSNTEQANSPRGENLFSRFAVGLRVSNRSVLLSVKKSIMTCLSDKRINYGDCMTSRNVDGDGARELDTLTVNSI